MRLTQLTPLLAALLLSPSVFAATNATDNNVQQSIDDMQKPNEAALRNAPTTPQWSRGAVITQGGVPRGDATPTWWTPNNLALKSSTAWNAATLWFVLYPGSKHQANNVRVAIDSLELYTLNRQANNQLVWQKITQGLPGWAEHYDYNLIDWKSQVNTRKESDGSVSYVLNANDLPVHGGINKFAIQGQQVVNIFARVSAHLVLDNPKGVDDRAKAQILMSVGADYYPNTQSNIQDFAPTGYNPGVGGSRYVVIKPEGRFVHFVSLATANQAIDPSPFVKNGGKITLTPAEYKANLPAPMR